MTIPVSEQLVNMVAVFMAVSLAAERVVQLLKNGLRTLVKKKAGGGKAGQSEAPGGTVETEGDWAKFWPRAAAVLVGICIAYLGREEIAPLLPTVFPKGAGQLGWQAALIIGLFSAAGSDLWSQLLGIIKDIKEAKKLDIQKALKNI